MTRDNDPMGVALWTASGLAGFLIARIVPFLRTTQWPRELIAAILAALAAGIAATALDFGGWGALDWRASAFAFFLALAAAGLTRLLSHGSVRRPV